VLSPTEGEMDSAGSARPDSSVTASLVDLLELQKLTVHSPRISTDSRTVYANLRCNLAIEIENILRNLPMVQKNLSHVEAKVVPKDDAVLPEVVSDFEIQVIEADHSDVGSSDSSVVYTHSIFCKKVCSPVLVNEYLRHQEKYPCSIWVLVRADLVPEAAV